MAEDEKAKSDGGESIYRGNWPGLGAMYNVKVDTGQTTIVVAPDEDVEERTKQTVAAFARKDTPGSTE